MAEWLEALGERLREFHETPWRPFGTVPFGACLLAILAAVGIHGASEDGWIPVLDSLNLVFHEAGHPVFSPFGEVLHILGGTILQLAVPLMVAGSAWARRSVAGTGLALAWCFQNGFNIARYLGDARAQELPLVGGGEHDWTALLGRWGLLERDLAIAGSIRGVAYLGLACVAAWMAWRWWQGRERG